MPTRWRWPAPPRSAPQQLIFLTDVEGVLDAAKQVRPLLTAAESEQLIAEGVATGGMQAKLNAALARCAAASGRCASRRARRRRVLRRILAGEHIGTDGCCDGGATRMISSVTRGLLSWKHRPASPASTVRKARDARYPADPRLSSTDMRPRASCCRARSSRCRRPSAISLWCYSDGQLLGCGALHFYSPTIAEIRSLAVHEHAKTHGVGRRLVEALVQEAQEYELDAVFAFTYVVEFFNRCRISRVERGVLPLKAWKDCLRCPEIPGVRRDRGAAHPAAGALGAGAAQSSGTRTTNLIQFPHLRS